MNRIESELTKKHYLTELKDCFTSPFAVFSERVCGIAIGPFFAIAYYSPYEWNRRITSECNRAWGYVREVDGKTEVNFIRGKGLLSPFWLVFFTLLFVVAIAVMISAESGDISDIVNEIGTVWMSGVIFSLGICGITAFHSSITEQGEAGAGEITRLLRDPKEYFC